MQHFPTYICYKMVHCGIWVLVHCGICAMGLLINQKFVLVNKSEFLGIKRSWIEKTYTINDMEAWFLFTAKKNAFFNNSGTRLAQRAETGLLDPVIFTVFLSSIQCNHAWWPYSTKLRNVALILYTLYLRHFLLYIYISFVWIMHHHSASDFSQEDWKVNTFTWNCNIHLHITAQPSMVVWQSTVEVRAWVANYRAQKYVM